jgi:hypothetical protein
MYPTNLRIVDVGWDVSHQRSRVWFDGLCHGLSLDNLEGGRLDLAEQRMIYGKDETPQ